MTQRAAFASGVPPDLYAFHRSTGSSTHPCHPPAGYFPKHFPRSTWGFHNGVARPPTSPLRPVNPNNACSLRITAAAGTELAGASFPGNVSVRPGRQRFTTRRPSSLTRRRCVRLSPIAQYSLLLPPVGVWAVSQSQCGRTPSQAGYPSSPWWAVTPPTS